MKTEMKMESRNLADLRPAEYNPRVQLQPADPEYQNIKRSIETFGYVDPIIINQDGTIIGGHQRYNVMRDLGYTEAQVVVVDLNKNDEKALNIALNKITGEWDEIKLKDLLLDLDLNDYDLTATGFSSKEVEDLVIRLDKDVEAEDDDFDADADYESIEEPATQRGDIWILGDHRLMCGDSTDLGDVNTLMGGEEADLVITDPPYNVNYKDGSIKNDNMDEGSFEDFLQNAFLAMFESMRPGAAAYIFHADSEGLAFRRAFRDAGMKLAECLIWEKNSFVLGRQDYQWRPRTNPLWMEGRSSTLLHRRPEPGHNPPGRRTRPGVHEERGSDHIHQSDRRPVQRPDNRPVREQTDQERRASDDEAGQLSRSSDAKLQQARLECAGLIRRKRIHAHGSRADRPPGVSDGA